MSKLILFFWENANLGGGNGISGLGNDHLGGRNGISELKNNAHLGGRNGFLWYLWDYHTSKILSWKVSKKSEQKSEQKKWAN